MRSWITGALLLLLLPVTSTAAEISVQEALLRAKPAVSLVVAEVGSEVIVTCGGGGDKLIRPAPFRETGTGWFMSPSGLMFTNAQLLSPAYQKCSGGSAAHARKDVLDVVRELVAPDLLRAP